MKKRLALIFCTCLIVSTVGCGAKKTVTEDESTESVNTYTEDTSIEEDTASLESNNSVDNISNEESGNTSDEMSIRDFVKMLDDINYYHTDTVPNLDKDSIEVTLHGETFLVKSSETNLEEIDSVIINGETPVQEESSSQGTLKAYTNGTDYRKVGVFESGMSDYYYYTFEQGVSPFIELRLMYDSFYDMAFNYEERILDESIPDDIIVDGISGNSTVQDVIDTYGMPDSVYADKKMYGDHFELVMHWENYINFKDGIYVAFDITESYDSEHEFIVTLETLRLDN